MNGISELLSKYGTSLAETRKLMPELTKAVRKLRVMPGKPLLFNPEEALDYGVELEPGWMLKVTPPKDGGNPSISYITPQNWEITEDQKWISPEGQTFTVDELESIGVEEEEVPSDEELLYKEYQRTGGVLALEDWISAGSPIRPLETEISQVFRRVFPGQDISTMLAEMQIEEQMPVPERIRAEQAQEEFIETILSAGRTEDTETLLRTMFPEITEEQISDFFGPEDLEENKLIQQELGYTPAPPVTSFEERQARVKAYKDYLKSGGRMLRLEWEHYGMPATAEDEPIRFTEEKRREVTLESQRKVISLLQVFGEGLTKVPKQLAASILMAIQGQGGASVVDKDWADRFIEDARKDLDKFAQETFEKYGEGGLPIKLSDVAFLPQNIAFSLTSMGAGLATGVPIAFAPVPGARVAAWTAGTAASGAAAYSMTTYQIMQEYLEIKNEEKLKETGFGLTREEETELKEEFEAKAREYGLWEAIPEAISNLAFAKILTAPLGKVVGKSIANRIIAKLFGLYGEELLTETITQKGQSAIEVEAGLREGNIDWVEAFKEVAPQTFLLTTVLAGLGQGGVSTINRIKTSLNQEIGEDHILHNDIEQELDSTRGDLSRIIEGTEEFVGEEEVTPVTPEVTAEMIPVGEIPTLETWDAMAVAERVKIAERLGFSGRLGSAPYSEFLAALREIPRAEPGMPEAEAKARIKELEKELKRITPEMIAPEVTEIPSPKVAIPLNEEIKSMVNDLEVEVEAWQATIKGLRGDEARMARETLKGLERELAYAKKTLDNFQKRPDLPEATKLRQTIMAWARIKGLPKTQLQKIMSSVAGRRQLRVIPQEQLVTILEKVKEARPVRIHGERVVTPKTEAKIQSLKESLISSRQMTNEIYDRLIERLNLRTDKYETAYKYITESKAKELIRAMNDEVVLAKWDIQVEDALAKHPQIKEVRDILNDRGMQGTGVEFNGEPIEIKRRAELWSMRFYMLELQKKLGAPVYDVWQKINMAHLVARGRHNQQLARLERSTPNFKEIVADEEALKRIEDYIASKHKLAKIKAPELSADELAVAEELERGYFEAQNDVRFIRFTNAYAENEGNIDLIAREIPNAPRRALRRAIDIYESKGAEALREFTDSQKWGVIEKGYDPRSFIKPVLYYFAPKETTFAKGFLRTRHGIEHYAEDRNIIQRYSRHQRQLIALQELSHLVRAFGRLYADNAHKLTRQAQRNVSRVLSRGINEMKGYREDAGAIVHLVERLYGQVASAVFWRPDLVIRNKFQNFAFNPDYWAGRFLNPKTRPSQLTESRRRFFEVFVSQERVFQFEYLLYGEKPLPGFGWLTRLARRTSLYPWSDKSNRAEAFSVRINRVDRALEAYERHGDIEKLIRDSGLNEFEPRQQAEALELLAMDKVDYGIDGMPMVSGKEAFALYNAQQLVNNVHFLYDRAQRAPAEMGATGKTLGNILVFNRSWGERFILQGRKLALGSKATRAEKIKAMTVIVGVIVAGVLAGEAYKRLTGKRHNPYNPLNIITWTPGGLALGVTEDISNTIYLMTQAAQGDKGALGSLPSVISNVATLTLPFYKNTIQALDACTDMKNIDVYAMRKIRELIDDEYEVRGGTHEVDRTLLEALQRAFFSKYDEPETSQEKIAEAELLLGTTIEEEDKPFSLEEPAIYNMRKLNGRFSQILGNIKPEEITKENGYSELAVVWVEKEGYENTLNSLPNKKLYEITELTEEQAGWASKNKRSLRLIEQYQGLDKSERVNFLEEHPELKVNPAIEWLKTHPKENAMLAIWGQAKIYSLEAYNEFERLVKELDIPEDAIPEQTLPPRQSVENYFKYLETGEELGYNSLEVQLIVAQDNELREFLNRQPIETAIEALELKVKHRELFDQYEAFGDKDSPLYIEDDAERDEARDKLKADNPEWVDDMRRIEAIEHGANEEIIDLWVEGSNVIDEFNAGSSEAKVWLIDHPEVHQWALDQGILTDDGSDWNEPVLHINAKWRTEDEEYDALPVEGDARANYLARNPAYRKDRWRRDAYSLGFPENQIENYVAYYELPDKGYRKEHFLIDNPGFGQAMHEITGMDLPEKSDIPAVGWDETYEKWQEDFDRLWGMSDHTSKYYIEDVDERAAARDGMRYDRRGNPTDFYKAEKRLDAYEFRIPEDLIDSFVEWYTNPKLKKPDDWEYDYWFEDDWFLMEHPRFYQTMLDLKIWLEPWDFSKVPTREVFNLYKTYLDLPAGQPRLDFRAKHPDLDAWGVLVKDWKPIGERGEKEAKKTPWEEAEEVKRFQELFEEE